jgi:hypothetical protein
MAEEVSPLLSSARFLEGDPPLGAGLRAAAAASGQEVFKACASVSTGVGPKLRAADFDNIPAPNFYDFPKLPFDPQAGFSSLRLK